MIHLKHYQKTYKMPTKKASSKAKTASKAAEKKTVKSADKSSAKNAKTSMSPAAKTTKTPTKKTAEKKKKEASLAKAGKAQLKIKEPVTFKPRKIEKIIDVKRLESKLNDIMSMDHLDFSVEEKLKALYILQEIDSDIDKIRTIRGELPMEVTDLEDEIVGLTTRVDNIKEEIAYLNDQVTKKHQTVKDSKEQIKKYESQQEKVKNNREFDSLNKEIEFQNLEIQLAEKRSKEFAVELVTKNAILEETQSILDDKNAVLVMKKAELESIVEETRKEEEQLHKISEKASTIVDERLLTAYTRVRKNARNGLGVVAIQRDACGGCFNKIPPQRQLDIRQHKKIIVCEHCGRILVDPTIGDEVPAE